MKALVTTLTFAAFALGATAAQASLQQGPSLSPVDRNAVQRMAPGLDLRNLSAEQVQRLSTFVQQAGNARLPDAAAIIRHIVERG